MWAVCILAAPCYWHTDRVVKMDNYARVCMYVWVCEHQHPWIQLICVFGQWRKWICGESWKTKPKLNLVSDFLFVESVLSLQRPLENTPTNSKLWFIHLIMHKKTCFLFECDYIFVCLCVQEMVRRGEILDDGMEDEFYLRRLDAGLFVLQLICYIMVEISNSGISQVHTHKYAHWLIFFPLLLIIIKPSD